MYTVHRCFRLIPLANIFAILESTCLSTLFSPTRRTWGCPTNCKIPLSRSPYKHYVVSYAADPLA